MKTTPLPSVEEVVPKEITHTYTKVKMLLTQDRNQAYTSLVKGIKGMEVIQKENEAWDTEQKTIAYGRNLVIRDILENVVKPLYGKE